MSPQSARIVARLQRIKTLPDLTDDGIGAELCLIASDGSAQSLADELDPDGNPLAPLSEAWIKAKGSTRIGVYTGVMHNRDEMDGEVTVTPDKAQVVYGKTEQAKAEAAWFQEGDPANNRPPRRFWGLTAASAAEAQQTTTDRYHAKIQDPIP